MAAQPTHHNINVLDRMVNAVEAVRKRLVRATTALRDAGVSYAVVGGNAVAAWVATVDEAAVRNTQDVDILIRRKDFGVCKGALEAAGFVYRHTASLDMFLDGPEGHARSAVHLLYADERVKPEQIEPNPRVEESQEMGGFRVLTLEVLVRTKLTVFRRKDQVHLIDMLELGLIDQSWTQRLPPILASRLQLLIDTPEG